VATFATLRIGACHGFANQVEGFRTADLPQDRQQHELFGVRS
jgi:hypothetical protein